MMARVSDLSKFELVVHATDEAGVKIGGPGAVLDGILSSGSYLVNVERSVVVGPMNTRDDAAMERLVKPSNDLDVEYSSYHGVDKLDRQLSAALGKIEASFKVNVLYGRRGFDGTEHEVILVDASRVVPDKVNSFKRRVYDRFGLPSDLYEADDEYNLHINAAEPSYLVLKTLIGSGRSGERFLIAHNYAGMPLVYSATLHDPDVYHTVFFAHEVATMRDIVENSYGHDTMFYNILKKAQGQGLFLRDVFGDQSRNFKHGILKTAVECDNILAVGDPIVDELRFMSPVLAQAHIDLVYNGLSNEGITIEDKMASQERLARYAVNLGLFDAPPDYVFTHVTRFIPSKAMWRDVRVLENLDKLLAAKKKRAVLYILASSIPGGRRIRDVHEWEKEYGWPVVHRQDNGDLQRFEIPFYQMVEAFNASAQATRIVLVNQFGWNPERCGERMPHDMVDDDIRWGSDLEFGQSTYEPFGIAQTESLSYGALCVTSSVCGFLGFVRQISQGSLPENIIVADYVTLPEDIDNIDYRAIQVLGQAERDRIESVEAQRVAEEIMARLPATKRARQKLLKQGYQLGQQMSWDTVVQHQLLPAMVRAASL
jgi:hypothetical protein